MRLLAFLLLLCISVKAEVLSDPENAYSLKIKIDLLRSLQLEGSLTDQVANSKIRHYEALVSQVSDGGPTFDELRVVLNDYKQKTSFFHFDLGSVIKWTSLALIFMTSMGLAGWSIIPWLFRMGEAAVSGLLWTSCMSSLILIKVLSEHWATPILLFNCGIFPVALARTLGNNVRILEPGIVYYFSIAGYYMVLSLFTMNSAIAILAVAFLHGSVLTLIKRRVAWTSVAISVVELGCWLFCASGLLTGRLSVFRLGLLWVGSLTLYTVTNVMSLRWVLKDWCQKKQLPYLRSYVIANLSLFTFHIVIVLISSKVHFMAPLRAFTTISFLTIISWKYIESIGNNRFVAMTSLLILGLLLYISSPYINSISGFINPFQ